MTARPSVRRLSARALVAPALVAVLALAGCSGSDDDTAAPATTDATATEDATATTGPTDDTEGDDTEGDTEGDDTEGDGTGSQALCQTIDDDTLGGEPGTPEFAEATARLAAQAPPELTEAFGVYATLGDVAAQLGPDSSLEERRTAMADAGVTEDDVFAADAAITSWTAENCG